MPSFYPNRRVVISDDKRITIEKIYYKRNYAEEYHYDYNDGYLMMRDIFNSMEQLFEWTLTLPNFKWSVFYDEDL